MRKRILSVVCSFALCCMMITISVIQTKASGIDEKIVDGSYLTTDDSSTGYSTSGARGVYLMTGDCSITKAGVKRVYGYASTTANMEVKYMATIAFVDQYDEETGKWGQYDWWMDDSENDFFLSISKSVTVERGYYYRVRAQHIAGNSNPYDETASVTNGVFVP